MQNQVLMIMLLDARQAIRKQISVSQVYGPTLN